MDILQDIQKDFMKKEIPEFRPGDTLRVHYRVVEGNKERTQIYEGIVIAVKGKGTSRRVTLRKVSYGVGVEWIFPIHSPRVEKIEVVNKVLTRRSKLYFLRELSQSEVRKKLRKKRT